MFSKMLVSCIRLWLGNIIWLIEIGKPKTAVVEAKRAVAFLTKLEAKSELSDKSVKRYQIPPEQADPTQEALNEY